MRVEIGLKRGTKAVDPKRSLMRRATSQRSSKYGISGNIKTGGHAPRPVTLATLKFTEPKPD